MTSWVAGACFIVAVFVVFFVYVGIGMASGDAAANKFLLAALGLGAVIGAGVYLARRGRKERKEE